MPDAAYSLTRRKGIPVTIVDIHGVTADPKLGTRVEDKTPTVIRLVVKEPTSYARLIRAQAAQQDIGETTFIFWIGDISSIPRLTTEDYLIADNAKFQVVSTSVEDTSYIVTAKEVVGEGNDPLIDISPI